MRRLLKCFLVYVPWTNRALIFSIRRRLLDLRARAWCSLHLAVFSSKIRNRPALSSESDLPPTLGKRCPPPGNAGGGSGGAGGGFERGTPVGKSSTPAAGVVVTPSRLGIKAPLFPRASSGGSIGFGSGGDSNSSSAASTPASAAKGTVLAGSVNKKGLLSYCVETRRVGSLGPMSSV